MTNILSRNTVALAFASLLALAPLAARAAEMPLPGQPGADTTIGQELRTAPYLRHENATATPVAAMHDTMAMHGDAMKQTAAMGVYDNLSVPENQIFN